MRGTAGGFVRLDRIVPEAETSEDVGRHMQGVRRCRCDLRVRSRRHEAAWSELCTVVCVDEVVSHTRMVGLSAVDGLEYVGGPFLVGVAAIRRWSGRNQRQRVKDLHFVIVREVPSDGLHRALVRFCPSRVVSWIRVAEVGSGGIDEFALAGGMCADPVRRRQLIPPELELSRFRWLPQLVEPRHRYTPVGKRASGIL